MTDEEFVRRVIAAEAEYDSDFLAWKIEEIVDEYKEDDSGH